MLKVIWNFCRLREIRRGKTTGDECEEDWTYSRLDGRGGPGNGRWLQLRL